MQQVKVVKCKEHGNPDLGGSTHNKASSTMPEEYLGIIEVTCQFVLGSNEFSETLVVASADIVATFLMHSRSEDENTPPDLWALDSTGTHRFAPKREAHLKLSI